MLVNEIILFSVFDPKKGPLILFSSTDDMKLANEVALKSFISAGLVGGEKTTIELILPFFSQMNEIAHSVFSFLFPLDSNAKTEVNMACISWIFPSEAKAYLFTKVPLIREVVKILRDTISREFSQMNNYDYLSRFIRRELSNKDSKINQQIFSISSEINDSQNFVLTRSVLFDYTTQHDILTILKAVPFDKLTQLMQSAILGDTIVFIADERIFNYFTGLLLFCYRGVARKIYLNKPTKVLKGNYNAIGVPHGSSMVEKVRDKATIIFNVYTAEVQVLNKTKELVVAKHWAKNLLLSQTIENLLPLYYEYLEDKNFYVDLILNSLSYYEDQAKNIEMTQKLVLDLQKSMNKEDFNFVMELSIRTNPHLENFFYQGLLGGLRKTFKKL